MKEAMSLIINKTNTYIIPCIKNMYSIAKKWCSEFYENISHYFPFGHTQIKIGLFNTRNYMNTVEVTFLDL